MSASSLAIVSTGLVTAVGLSAPSSCAAIRAKLTNPSETRFVDSGGRWIMAHQVPLERPWGGLTRLARMASMAIEEAMGDLPTTEWHTTPVLLCVAEPERPGRIEGLDDRLWIDIQRLLNVRFASESAVVPHGRIAVAVALSQARALISQSGVERVLIVATDSLLSWPTLGHYEQCDRLLTQDNSDGFMPGEGAGAFLVERPKGAAQLGCIGLGFGAELASIESDHPQRADGLTHAINVALADAGCYIHEMDLRIADLSGEQYYFKEATLALLRTLRKRKEEFDVWHPAECTGEAGSVAGCVVVALADAACRKGYAKGSHILTHLTNDGGQRAAIALRYGGAR